MQPVLTARRNLVIYVARGVMGVCLTVTVASLVTRAVSQENFWQTPKNSVVPPSLGAWWVPAASFTTLCYLLTVTVAIGFGWLLGAVAASPNAAARHSAWYNGVIRRGLELTGAVPSVIVAGLWLSTHPGRALPALVVATIAQQGFEVGSRVKHILEGEGSVRSQLAHELRTSVGQIAITLASGEAALVFLGLTSLSYTTWPSTLASCLSHGPDAPRSLMLLALAGTLGLPTCLYLSLLPCSANTQDQKSG